MSTARRRERRAGVAYNRRMELRPIGRVADLRAIERARRRRAADGACRACAAGSGARPPRRTGAAGARPRRPGQQRRRCSGRRTLAQELVLRRLRRLSRRCPANSPPTPQPPIRRGAMPAVPLARIGRRAASCGLIVDGLFGIGLSDRSRAKRRSGSSARMRARVRILALDIPSGLNADTGIAYRADHSRRRQPRPSSHSSRACSLPTARIIAGLIVVHALGLDAAAGAPRAAARLALASRRDCRSRCAGRSRNVHKGSFGTLAIVGGNDGMVGAAHSCRPRRAPSWRRQDLGRTCGHRTCRLSTGCSRS